MYKKEWILTKGKLKFQSNSKIILLHDIYRPTSVNVESTLQVMTSSGCRYAEFKDDCTCIVSHTNGCCNGCNNRYSTTRENEGQGQIMACTQPIVFIPEIHMI